MNRLREEPFFEQILLDARTDANSVFFAIGSIFGGTGAAGLPVLGRALVDGVAREEGRNPVQGVDSKRVGAALLLPYFTLPTPDAHNASDGGIRPEAALFAQNAAAALPTYTAGQAGFSAMYVLGDDQPREQKHNAVGGSGLYFGRLGWMEQTFVGMTSRWMLRQKSACSAALWQCTHS
jgi:hypothetical protein